MHFNCYTHSCSYNSIPNFLHLVLLNEGKACYKSCAMNSGPCQWCGSDGLCCNRKPDWNDLNNGCDHKFGGQKTHRCVLDQLKGK